MTNSSQYSLVEKQLKELDFVKKFHVSASLLNNHKRMKVLIWINEASYVAWILTEEQKIEDLIKEIAYHYKITFDIYYE